MKIERIEWMDACGYEGGWATLDELSAIGPATVSSVGYVIAETDEHVALVSNWDEGNGNAFGHVLILNRCIKRREVLG